MLGTRGIWHDGWKAVTEHAPMPSDKGHFDQDRWQLFHTDEDRSEAPTCRAAPRQGEGARRPVVRGGQEVQRPASVTISDCSTTSATSSRPPVPKSGLYTYFPGTAEIPERSAANFHGVSYKILAEVQIADASAQGVILAHGSRFGGHALFIKDRKLHYVYNFLGLKPEQHLESEPLDARPRTCSASSSSRRARASTASHTAPPSCTSTRTS